MNHTLGPWEFFQNEMEGAEGMTVKGGKFVVKDGVDIAYIPVSSSEANARLIAAAPDLHSALIMANNWLSCEDRDEMDPHDRAIYDDIMDSINKALNKASS